MKIIPFSDKLNIGSVICLGRFDGLHIGHRKLFEEGKRIARKKGLSFCVFTIRPLAPVDDILSFEELSGICEKLGVETLIFAEDDKNFFDTPPSDFTLSLTDRFSAKHLVCGEDFSYGKDRGGSASSLRGFCRENAVGISVIDILSVDGKKVSSTGIKELLKEGKIRQASELLCGDFSVSGEVSHGRQDGRRLGFSTANIAYPIGKVKVKRGVYATKTVVDEKEFYSISNFGPAPTFNCEKELLETHVIGFDGDLYGKSITVKFIDFLRENKKFDDKEQLIAQLKKDLKYYD